MDESKRRRPPFYWERFVVKSEASPDAAFRLPPGAELAALRRGIGKEPGVPPSSGLLHPASRARLFNEVASGRACGVDVVRCSSAIIVSPYAFSRRRAGFRHAPVEGERSL